jgi:hypothetical protein
MSSFDDWADKAMSQALFLGVVILGRFVPDSGFGLFGTYCMSIYPKTVDIICVLNEMYTNSYTGPTQA